MDVIYRHCPDLYIGDHHYGWSQSIRYQFIRKLQKAMDSLTHFALGACIGEVFLGKNLGKKALLLGGLVQSLPDVDAIPALWISPDRALLVHRGPTHSFLFAILAGLSIALIIKAIDKKIRLPLAILTFFCSLQLIAHDLLDTCNSYGTGLLEPFNHHRFSINLLYVADPVFSISLVTGCLWLMFKNGNSRYHKAWACGFIGTSLCYLGFSVYFKTMIDRKLEATFKGGHISVQSYFSTPAPFTSLLWYIVIKDHKGYFTGYSSVMDAANRPLSFERHNTNEFLLAGQRNSEELRNLKNFANDHYVVTRGKGVVYFNILRFGQVQGWQTTGAPFVLGYSLGPIQGQMSVLQKGRLTGWNKQTIIGYLKRISGEQVNNPAIAK